MLQILNPKIYVQNPIKQTKTNKFSTINKSLNMPFT